MSPRPPRWRVGLRAGLWLALTLWIVGGPFATQVLNLHVPAVKRWLMFIGYGKEICDVRYYLPGEAEPVDRLGVLGYPESWEAPRGEKMLTDADHVRRQGRTLCRELGVDTLHVQARCGAMRGWKPAGDPPWAEDENLCAR